MSRHRAEAISPVAQAEHPGFAAGSSSGARFAVARRVVSLRAATPTRTGIPTVNVRSRSALPLFASAAALAVILVSVTSPMSQNSAAAAEITSELRTLPTQQLAVEGSYSSAIVRDSYSLTEKAVPAAAATVTAAVGGAKATQAAPAAGVPNPGSAQDIARQMVADRGWGDDQFNCLVALWNRESGWNAFAHNGGSGAYGIPQALPGTKMASAGADWATNPATQITWGLGYISGRYGTPCGAWASSQSKGWY